MPAAGTRTGNRARGRYPALTAAGVAILLAAWALTSVLAGTYFVPPPWTTVVDTAVLLAGRFAWSQILITVLRVCIGFAVGFLAGVVLGIAIGARRSLEALFRPAVLFFQGMPPLLWAIPLVALMGVGHLPSILVIALITFPVVAVTIGEGMSSLPKELGEMLSVFAPGFTPRLKELILPHLAPFLAASLKAGVVLAVKASVTAEYFGANDGIGFQIQAAYMSIRIRSLFAWAIVLVLLITVANRLLPQIRRLRPVVERLFVDTGPLVCRLEDERALDRALAPDGAPSRGGIQLRSVSFAYPRQPPLMNDLSLSVPPDGIVIVRGDSGAGKTTLLKLTAALLRPAAGSVSGPRRIAFVFQDDRFLPWRSVLENVALPLRYQGYAQREALCFASILVRRAGLDGESGTRPEELSGGMKKRAALARCFARLPDAILLDEPFSGLHREARRELWEWFLEMHARRPVPTVIVTHFPEEVRRRGSPVMTLRGRPARIEATRS